MGASHGDDNERGEKDDDFLQLHNYPLLSVRVINQRVREEEEEADETRRMWIRNIVWEASRDYASLGSTTLGLYLDSKAFSMEIVDRFLQSSFIKWTTRKQAHA